MWKKTDEIRKGLFDRQDKKYAAFQAKLLPNIDASTIIGVRTPDIKKYASDLAKDKDIDIFLNALPHEYFDENQLHAFIISKTKDYNKCVELVNKFLPYVDNWATCDQLSPNVFKKHKEELLVQIDEWIKSGRTYTVRFAIGMLMQHYLDGDFKEEYLKKVASVRSGEYYINMIIAWYFATALAKQYALAVQYIEGRSLDAWTHNKAIQKAVESRRINDEQKAYLKTLKIKNKG